MWILLLVLLPDALDHLLIGVSEGTVKVQFARGLRRLREELADWE